MEILYYEILEGLVREAIGKPEGDIYPEDVKNVTELYLEDYGVNDLSGLEYFTSLEYLNAKSNNISSIEPLSPLVKMRLLHLGFNEITDITPLASLCSLKNLTIAWNPIEDITSITNMESLVLLNASGMALSGELPSIENLVNLEMLLFHHNKLTQIDNLEGHPTLWELKIHYNQITDISVLLTLSSLVSLECMGNPLSEESLEVIQILRENGVGIDY